MNWNQCRVFVTGATGIVGSWLVKQLLQKGAYLVTLIRDWDPQSELIRSGTIRQTSVVHGALEDYATLERAINEQEIDTVFHLGAQTIVGTALRNPLPTFEANIRGTYNLLEACRIHQDLVKRVVVASSDKAYGEAPILPYTEEMPLQGQHPYDVSKSCTDLLAMAYAHTYHLPVTVARCGNIYGGGDLNWSRIVPGTIRSVLQNRRPVLRSDGQYTRDYLFVLDVVEAYLLLASRTPEEGIRGEAFNFSTEHPVQVLDITQRILSLMERTDLEPHILNQARAEIRDQHLDASKAKRLLHWKAQYSLEEGLSRTIDWYRAFLST
ncbi:MAG: NAD-dependent epimerase/dehydratase family protein [Nitrospinota bacterium]|nr:MAG: NAD-dependent epimerase/dehydratase family protein [Nitrospinota bacterium]